MKSPIFLIGTQRSGTTLLCKMLSAHKDVFIKNEVPILKVFSAGADKFKIQNAIDRFVKLQYGKSIAELLETENKKIWGLKDPELTDHLPAIEQFLPDAKFIIIIRDGRAVVRSYIENAWGLGTNCYTGAIRWNREVEKQLAFEKAHPENVLKISFENLVSNQMESLKKICEFLEIPFDSSMIDYTDKKSFIVKKRESINTFKKPDPKIATKWKNKLSPHQVKVINMVCEDTLKKLNYEVKDKYLEIPLWLESYYKIHQKILGEVQIQYRWRIGGFKLALKRLFKPK